MLLIQALFLDIRLTLTVIELTKRYTATIGGDALQKSLSNRIGMKFGRIVLQVSSLGLCVDWRREIFDLTSHVQDGGHDVISCRKSAATWWVHTQRPPGACCCICRFVVHSYTWWTYLPLLVAAFHADNHTVLFYY